MLCLSTVFRSTAAQMEPILEPSKIFTVTITDQEPFWICIPQSVIDQIPMLKASIEAGKSGLFADDDTLYLRENYSRKGFGALIDYLYHTTAVAKSIVLSRCTSSTIDGFIHSANALAPSYEHEKYALIKHILETTTIGQLRTFTANNFLQNNTLIISTLLKETQLRAIAHCQNIFHEETRSLSNSTIGYEKMNLLRKHGLDTFEMSIQDLYEHEITRHTRHSFIVMNCGPSWPRVLFLRSYGLTSLKGIELISDPDADSLSIKHLDLQGNRITAIDKDFFPNLPYITELDLSNNRITTIDPAFFLKLPSLKKLIIDYNPLSDDAKLLIIKYGS